MKTNNLFEELKKYFENTSNKKVLEDWGKSEKFDEVGPSIEEFIDYSNKHYTIHLKDPVSSDLNFKNSNLSPEFSSGFLFNKNYNYANSCVFIR